MPVFGIGLHLLVALFFAFHVVRSGQNLFWLLLLFSFPLIGSAIYLFAVYLPDSRLPYGASRALASSVKMLDPTRELRKARAAFKYTSTAQNQMRLAAALLAAGEAKEAVANYEACLAGPFASDLEIRLGAAQANFELGQYQRAIEHLERIRGNAPEFRPEQISLWLAKSFAEAGQGEKASAEFEAALARFGSFDVKAEYLIWALKENNQATIARLKVEVQQTTERWGRPTKTLNRATLRRLDAAYAHAKHRS